MKLSKTVSFIFCSVFLLTIDSSKCNLETDEFCQAPSNDQVIGCKSADVIDYKSDDVTGCRSDEFLDSEDKIPPSWVNYLHNYEDSKLKWAKSCKGDVVIEDVSINCNFAKTIQDDLHFFNENKIRQIQPFH